MKAKDFTEMRKWVVQNLDNDPVKIFRKIYDNLYDNLQPETIPHAVLILADYQHKSAFVFYFPPQVSRSRVSKQLVRHKRGKQAECSARNPGFGRFRKENAKETKFSY